jgi:HSP20 family molecular chaperone IbpA
MTQLMMAAALCGPAPRVQGLPKGTWKSMIQAAEARLVEPSFALETTDGAYVLRAALPGAGATDVRVDVEGTTLWLRGLTEQRFTDRRRFGYVRQRPVEEKFTLPLDARTEAIDVTWESSVLTVRIPRAETVDVDATETEPLR